MMPRPLWPVDLDVTEELVTDNNVAVVIAKCVGQEVCSAGPSFREAPRGGLNADHDNMLGEVLYHRYQEV